MSTSIWDAGDQQMKSAQAKITYLGEQTKPIPTVVFGVQGHKVAMVRFLEVQRSLKPYVNDESPYTKSFSLSLAEFRNALASVRPVVSASEAAAAPFLSFCVVMGAGDALVGEEFLIPRAAGRQLFDKLLGSLSPDNEQARTILSAQRKNVFPGE